MSTGYLGFTLVILAIVVVLAFLLYSARRKNSALRANAKEAFSKSDASQTIYCPYCGKKPDEDDSAFCPFCGKPLR